MSKRILIGLLALACFGCDEAVDTDPSGINQAEEAAASTVGILNPAILPAHKLPGENRVPGKQDAASDYRKAHPQWYAITEPPLGNFRPMKEWEPMQANLITYSNYLPSDDPVAQTLADTAIESLVAVDMWVVANSASAKNDLINRMKAGGVTDKQIEDRVKFFEIENDAIWTIDFGPFPLVNTDSNTVAFTDYRYYHPRVHDDAIPTRLGNRIGVTTYRSPFDFEGGNFQADGEEFCYFGERVYQLTGMSFAQVEALFQAHYGCKKAVVLKDITNDGTGHIDMFFKLGGKHVAFVGDYTVVDDPINEQRMDDNVAVIEGLEYADGSAGIKVFRIPMPNIYQNTPRTFINSTLVVGPDGKTKLNLWPMYTVDKDLEAEALDAWEEGLPGWEHIGIISDQISLYSGAIHCVTRTIPALPFEKWVADGVCVDGACVGGEGAYDGTCIAETEEDPGCWGGQWACTCNYCQEAGCDIPGSCGNGTCDATETCFNCAKDCGCEGDQVCSVVAGKCASETCGNGVCDAGENCSICVADCGCKGNEQCSFGVCVSDPCGGIKYEGCCDGSQLVYCDDDGALVTNECGGDGCGWVADKKWFDCGGNGEDPAGKLPLDCHDYDYPPGCEGIECGDNGGGYSCGQCPDGLVCLDGSCGPDPCAGVCGDDECGEVDGCDCGDCEFGSTCEDGVCVPDVCYPVANCKDRECGDDGCGGLCGACEAGFGCQDGVCVEGVCDRVTNCFGKECGDDGCGGVCGECGAGLACNDGACVEGTAEGGDDVISQGDIAGTADTITGADGSISQPDAGDDDDKDTSDGCSTGTGSGSAGAGLLFVLMLLGLAVVRRATATLS